MKIERCDDKLGGLHQEWASGQRTEDGLAFSLSVGAGLGNDEMYCTIDGIRYQTTVREIVETFFAHHDEEVRKAGEEPA